MISSIPSKVPIADEKTSFSIWNWLKDVYNWMIGETGVSPVIVGVFGTSIYPSTYYDYPIDATAGNLNVILPLAANAANKKYLIKKIDSTTNQIAVTASGSDTIDGAAYVVLYNQYDSIEIISDGISKWHVLAGGTSTSTVSGARDQNWIVNGQCQVAQRPVPNLSAVSQYGKVDRYKCDVYAGAVTAGTITQDTTGVITNARAPYALKLAGVSLNAGSSFEVVYTVEAKDAVHLKNAAAVVFSFKMRHDVGSTMNFQVLIDTPTAADNYAAETTIYNSALFAVATATNYTYSVVFPPGDCSNGFRIYIYTDGSPAITTKNFYFTEFLLQESPVLTTYPDRSFQDELKRCQRYYQKSFNYTVAPAQNTNDYEGAVVYRASVAGIISAGVYIKYPVPTRLDSSNARYTFYNPGAANDKWRNFILNTDSGTGTNATGSGEQSLFAFNQQVAGDLVGNGLAIHYTVDTDF